MSDSRQPNTRDAQDDNALRYTPGQGRQGHVESYFIRANDPHRSRAIWLKATIFAPQKGGTAQADIWCALFDASATRPTWALRQTVPFGAAQFGHSPLRIAIGDCVFFFSRHGGRATGKLQGSDGCSWDLRWEKDPGTLGAPLSLYPNPYFERGVFPRSKLLTPAPVCRFSGTFKPAGDAPWSLEGWSGMQGHNWGREHAHEYAWGQCIFRDGSDNAFCMVEGFTGRVAMGRLVSPAISSMVVRHGEGSYRFDRVFRLWQQEAEIGEFRWQLKMHGNGHTALLTMEAQPQDFVLLGYRNPNGTLAYCFNSKVAHTLLRVNPADGEPFQCQSAHGGALEFLRPHGDPRFGDPV